MRESRSRAAVALVVVIVAAVAGCSSAGSKSAPAVSLVTQAQSSTAAPSTTILVGPLTGLPEGVPGDLPDGSYQISVSDADLAAVNMPEARWPEFHGTFVWTMTGGIWTMLQTAPPGVLSNWTTGTYGVAGDHVTMHYSTPHFADEEFTWVANADGSLRFTALTSTSQLFSAWMGSHPLVPVAG